MANTDLLPDHPAVLHHDGGDAGDPLWLARFRVAAVLGGASAAVLVISQVLMPHLGSTAREAVPKIAGVADRLLVAHLVFAVASLLFVPMTLVPSARSAPARAATC